MQNISKSISSSIAALNNQIGQPNQAIAIAAIQASIKSVGQILPIVMDGQVVVDGHKRLVACQNLEIEPKCVQIASLNNHDPLAIWTSLNLCRTHMSQNERALAACELYRLRPPAPNGKKLTQEQICENLKISDETVGRIRKAQELATQQGTTDEVMERIKRGDSPRQILCDLETKKIAQQNNKTYCKTNHKVAQQLHQMAALGQKFSFIYADPPWAEAVRSAPYPTMPTGKDGDVPNKNGTYPSICAMAGDIKALAAKDSVLWLWTTSSLLVNGLGVLEAWGFKYVTSIIWVKDHANASKGAVLPKHEVILVGKMLCDDGEVLGEDQDIVLVAKRNAGLGSPRKPIKPIASVIELPLHKVVHSQKPEEVADAAAGLYPTQAKLELFARQPRNGWTTWGNQSNGKALKQLAAPKPRDGGHHSNPSAPKGATQHRGRGRPRKQVEQPATAGKAIDQSNAIEKYKRAVKGGDAGEVSHTKDTMLKSIGK